MEIILRAEQIQNVDKLAIDQFGFSPLILMENAAERIYQRMKPFFLQNREGLISFLIGKGNNGGDGLVVARKAFQEGFLTQIYIFAESEKELSASALANLYLCKSLKIPYIFISDKNQYSSYKAQILKSAFLIDAILGVGLSKPLKGFLEELVDNINGNYKNCVFAVDVPTGLSTSEGFYDPILKADKTFTVETPKYHMLDFPGKSFCGEIHTVKIGFPKKALEDQDSKSFLVEDSDIKVSKRSEDSHKGSYGRMLLIGGSSEYTGAPQLALSAAIKTGAGLLYYYGKAESYIRAGLPEIINLYDLEELLYFDSIVIGPGWAKGELSILERILKEHEGNLVLDADALNLLARHKDLLENRKRTLLTPHLGEFSRLIEKEIRWIKENKEEALKLFAKNYPDISVLLKDSVSVLYDKGEFFYLNWGSPALSRGGSGDLLAGLIGGFSAYMPLRESVFLSCFLNGKTAEYLSDLKGDVTLSISDFPKYYEVIWQKYF